MEKRDRKSRIHAIALNMGQLTIVEDLNEWYVFYLLEA